LFRKNFFQFRENANKVIAKKHAEELLKPQINNILQPSVSLPPLAMPSNATEGQK
jgi:hypothetical protein